MYCLYCLPVLPALPCTADMFHSEHAKALLHATARAVSGERVPPGDVIHTCLHIFKCNALLL